MQKEEGKMTVNEINKIILEKIMGGKWCDTLPCFSEDRPNYPEDPWRFFVMLKRLVASGYWFDFHHELQTKYPIITAI
jgi:hypothetical protein